MSISIMKDAKDTMSNAKEATASARMLMDNLDKRTDEITIGVNRMTATATKPDRHRRASDHRSCAQSAAIFVRWQQQ